MRSRGGSSRFTPGRPWLRNAPCRIDPVMAGRRCRRACRSLLLVLILPPTLNHAAALTLHAVLATSDAGRPIGLRNFADVRYASLWSPRGWRLHDPLRREHRQGRRCPRGTPREPRSASRCSTSSTPFQRGSALARPRETGPGCTGAATSTPSTICRRSSCSAMSRS